MSEKLLSITDIVNEYGVSRKTVQRWIKDVPPKIVPEQTLSGKTGAHLFTRAEADRAFAAHRDAKNAKAEEAQAQ